MIAPSSVPMTSSAIMLSFSAGASVPGSSPNSSTHSSLSPPALDSSSDMQSSSASAGMASPPVSMDTSPIPHNGNDSIKQHKLKKPLQIGGATVTHHPEVAPGLLHFHPPAYSASAEAHHQYQNDAIMREDLIHEAIRQQQIGLQSSSSNHQGLTYEALQAVSSVSNINHHGDVQQLDSQRRHGLSQLTTVTHTSADISAPFVSNQSQSLPNHPHVNVNGELVPVNGQSIVSPSIVSVAASDGMQQAVAPIYVQMQNGTIQALPFQPGMPSNAAMAAQIANLAGLGQQNGMFAPVNVEVNSYPPSAGTQLNEMTTDVHDSAQHHQPTDDSDKNGSYPRGRGVHRSSKSNSGLV